MTETVQEKRAETQLERLCRKAGVPFSKGFQVVNTFTDFVTYKDDVGWRVFQQYLIELGNEGAQARGEDGQDKSPLNAAQEYYKWTRDRIMQDGRSLKTNQRFHKFSRRFYQPFLDIVRRDLGMIAELEDPVKEYERQKEAYAQASAGAHAELMAANAAARQLVANSKGEPAMYMDAHDSVLQVVKGLSEVQAWERPASNINALAGAIKVNYWKDGKEEYVGKLTEELNNLKTWVAYYADAIQKLDVKVKAIASQAGNAGGKQFSDKTARDLQAEVNEAAGQVLEYRESLIASFTYISGLLEEMAESFASWAKSHTVRVWKDEYAAQHPEIEVQHALRDQSISVGFTALGTGLAPTVIGPIIAAGVYCGVKGCIWTFDQLMAGKVQLEQEVMARSTETTLSSLGKVSKAKLDEKGSARNWGRRGRVVAVVASNAISVGANAIPYYGNAVGVAVGQVPNMIDAGAGVSKRVGPEGGFVEKGLSPEAEAAATFALTGAGLPQAQQQQTTITGADALQAAIDRAWDNNTWDTFFQQYLLPSLNQVAGASKYGFFQASLPNNLTYARDDTGYYVANPAFVEFVGTEVPGRACVTYELELWFSPEGETWYDTGVPDFNAHGRQDWKDSYWNLPSTCTYINGNLINEIARIPAFDRYVLHCYDVDEKKWALFDRPENQGSLFSMSKVRKSVLEELPSVLANAIRDNIGGEFIG